MALVKFGTSINNKAAIDLPAEEAEATLYRVINPHRGWRAHEGLGHHDSVY